MCTYVRIRLLSPPAAARSAFAGEAKEGWKCHYFTPYEGLLLFTRWRRRQRARSPVTRPKYLPRNGNSSTLCRIIRNNNRKIETYSIRISERRRQTCKQFVRKKNFSAEYFHPFVAIIRNYERRVVDKRHRMRKKKGKTFSFRSFQSSFCVQHPVIREPTFVSPFTTMSAIITIKSYMKSFSRTNQPKYVHSNRSHQSLVIAFFYGFI